MMRTQLRGRLAVVIGGRLPARHAARTRWPVHQDRVALGHNAQPAPGKFLAEVEVPGALDGKAALPPNPVRPATPIPPPTFTVKATPAEITEGGGLFGMYCRRCHNPDFNYVKSGSIPDLRRANEATHATFEQIVRGGARRTLGMPSFAKDISSDQVRMIEAYVLDQARQVSSLSRAAEGGH